MSVALAISIVLVAGAPDPVAVADVSAVLGKGWWCTWDAEENGCSAIQRYDFARKEIYVCTGTDVAWFRVATGWADDGLATAEDARPLIESLQARADAHGARLIKFCWTSSFKLDERGVCQRPWSTTDRPTMRLSRNGAWSSEDDVLIPEDEAEVYYRFWPAAFDEMVAGIPATALSDPAVKSFVAVQTAEIRCETYARSDAGVLTRSSGTAGQVYVDEMRPLARPEDGVMVQRLE
ncbi:MAG TPA: hypothetical protein VGR32_00740 [Brevundimonas sp.]|jgi:hypothetical protein|uniref:hypothetical protein n=1 Tax=Brevundimonas sp. TaxID=1871086 RepID=UPI002DECB95D|nr:hypothetical protein [Brevundimonas sp.]